jgi:hypothetical protein
MGPHSQSFGAGKDVFLAVFVVVVHLKDALSGTFTKFNSR